MQVLENFQISIAVIGSIASGCSGKEPMSLPGGGGGGVDRIRESDRYRSYRSYCTRIHKITFTYLLIDVYERGLQACVWSVLGH